MKGYRIIIINEETGDLLKNELIDEDLADQISGIIEDGFVDTYEESQQKIMRKCLPNLRI